MSIAEKIWAISCDGEPLFDVEFELVVLESDVLDDDPELEVLDVVELSLFAVEDELESDVDPVL